MSAIMLPRLHIHCLVAAGFLELPEAEDPYESNEAMKFAFRPEGERRQLNEGTADEIGQALTDANLSSLIAAECAYADCIAPGDIAPYKWPGLKEALTTPVETLNAIDCYEYQAGEHFDWNGSTAQRYCETLRRHMSSLFRGYQEAGWVLLAERVAERSGLVPTDAERAPQSARVVVKRTKPEKGE